MTFGGITLQVEEMSENDSLEVEAGGVKGKQAIKITSTVRQLLKTNILSPTEQIIQLPAVKQILV